MSLTRLPGFTLDTSSNVTFANANVTGNLTSGNANLGNAVTANFFIGSGNNLSNIQAANITGTINLATFAGTANAVAGANVSGFVANANIANTAFAVAGANVSGFVANANVANIAFAVAGANVSGEVSFAATANAVAGANVSGFVANANVANTAFAVAGANVSGAVSYATTANAVAGANVSGQVANATIAGTVYTNAQPNITSVGTLTGLTVNGNSTINNVSLTGNIIPSVTNTYALGNATHYFKDAFIGPGSLYVNGKKVLEEVSGTINFTTDINQNLKITTSGSGDILFDPTGTGVISIKGPLQIEAGINITSSDGNAIHLANPLSVDSITTHLANTDLALSANGTGTIRLNDDVTVSGNLTVSGTTTYINTETVQLYDNIIDLNSNFTTGSPTENAGIRVLRGDDAAVLVRWNETTDKWQYTTDGSVYVDIVGTTSLGVTNLGNSATANYFTGNGSLLTSITGANVTGYVPTATVANTSATVTTAAQPNITSVGTLTSLAVTGNISAGNVKTDNLLYANGVAYSLGSGATVAGANTQIQFNDSGSFGGDANLTFNKTTATLTANYVTGTLTTVAQPNITSVGTLSSLTVGNATANTIFGNGTITSNGNISFTGASVSLGSVSNLNITGGAANYFLKTDGAGSLSWAVPSGGTSLTYTANTAPLASGNVLGDQWFNTATNVLYEYINDGTSSYWVDTSSPSTSTNSAIAGTITIQDEGSNLTNAVSSINFVGGVTATNTGNAVTVTIPSGSNNARTTGYSLVFGG